jgi:hypothetical protein
MSQAINDVTIRHAALQLAVDSHEPDTRAADIVASARSFEQYLRGPNTEQADTGTGIGHDPATCPMCRARRNEGPLIDLLFGPTSRYPGRSAG